MGKNDLDMAYEGLTGNGASSRLQQFSNGDGRIIRATGIKIDQRPPHDFQRC